MGESDSAGEKDDTPAWEACVGLCVIPPLGAVGGAFVAAGLFDSSGGPLAWVLGIVGAFVGLIVGVIVLPLLSPAGTKEDDPAVEPSSDLGGSSSQPVFGPDHSAAPASDEIDEGSRASEGDDPYPPEQDSEPEEDGQAATSGIPLRFFLDEEGSPMSLSVMYDPGGPDELGVALGTFESRDDAMSAVEQVRRALEDETRRWANVAHAMLAVQPFALELPGNLGLAGSRVGKAQPHSVDEEHSSDDAREAEHAHGSEDGVVAQVLDSAVFTEQRRRARRTSLSDEQIASLLRRLMSAPGHRIYQSSAAEALEVPVFQLPGALPVAQRLLNVDQYPVLYRDPDSLEIVLDLDLLQEQFGVIT